MTGGPSPQLPPADRRRVLRAALLRPWALIVLAIGLIFFALTRTWWALPLTLATYASLVVLAVRDPIFQTFVLEGREKARLAMRNRARRVAGISPKTRARQLREGETRDKLQSALEARERVVVAINGSDEVTRDLFADAVPELDRTAELLVDLAETREGAPKDRGSDTLSAIDTEISQAPERLHALRSEVIRASIESDDAALIRANGLKESLNETNRRLRELRASIEP